MKQGVKHRDAVAGPVALQRGAWGRVWRRAALSVLALAVAAAGAFWATPVRAAGGEVNVYSYRQPFLMKPLFDSFTKTTGIRVNVVYAPKGMVERVRQEGRNSPADVILTVDVGRLHDAVQAGILQSVHTPTLEANVPAAYRHPEGLWYGLTLRSRAIFASKERVPVGTLRTYEALATPQWKGRICMRSSQHAYNIGLLAAMIVHHGEKDAEAWARGLLKNLARKPQGNDRAQVRAIKEGECDVALVNSYYMGAMLHDPEQVPWAESVYIIFPNQDGSGAHVNISGAGVAAHAPNRDNAVRLLEYLSSDKAQHLYAEKNFEYPVKPGVPWSSQVAAWGHFKADDIPLDEIAKRRAQAIRIFDRVGFP